MGGTILIAVKRPNQIEEIIPSLKNAVKAGTRVVFLVRYHVSSFQLCCLNYVETLQPGALAALTARYSRFGTQAKFLEHRISAACEVLSSQGIVVIVHPYTGGLRKAIRKYTAREDVQLIMMAKGAAPKGMRFVERLLRLIPFFKMTPDSALRSYFATSRWEVQYPGNER